MSIAVLPVKLRPDRRHGQAARVLRMRGKGSFGNSLSLSLVTVER